MKANMWFLYVVQCCDKSYYAGVTTDIKRRLHEHNTTSRGAKYTKTRRPVVLIYQQEFTNRSEAQRAEYAFKQLRRKDKDKFICSLPE